MHLSLETPAPVGPGITKLNCRVLLAMQVLHLPAGIVAGLLAECPCIAGHIP